MTDWVHKSQTFIELIDNVSRLTKLSHEILRKGMAYIKCDEACTFNITLTGRREVLALLGRLTHHNIEYRSSMLWCEGLCYKVWFKISVKDTLIKDFNPQSPNPPAPLTPTGTLLTDENVFKEGQLYHLMWDKDVSNPYGAPNPFTAGSKYNYLWAQGYKYPTIAYAELKDHQCKYEYDQCKYEYIYDDRLPALNNGRIAASKQYPPSVNPFVKDSTLYRHWLQGYHTQLEESKLRQSKEK